MIQTKDLAGNTVNVASRGVANAGLTTGIIGTVLGVMNNGGLGNILGASASTGACVVDKDTYYRDMINQINITNAQNMDTNNKICALQERVAKNEVANMYQNEITKIGFANVDNRFATEDIINEKNLDLAICKATKNVVYGNTYLAPNRLADPYSSDSRVIDTHAHYTPGVGFAYDEWSNPCGGCGN